MVRSTMHSKRQAAEMLITVTHGANAKAGRAWVAFIVLLVVAALAAQAPSPAPQQPTFKVGVNYVRVDAYPMLGGKPAGDLTKADFEIYEDGVLQKVDTFEHIVVRPRNVTQERVEPRNAREANQMAADARNRLFVLFLDTYHVTELTAIHSGPGRLPGSTTTRRSPDEKPLMPGSIERALVNFLERAVSRTDLFATFTPEMDVEQLSFTRRPDNFEQLARTVWARRFSWDDLDPEEERWVRCYPYDDVCNCYAGIVVDMVRRHREQLTLQALTRLAQRLGDLREERKAVLLVSEGWTIFRPDQHLARPLPLVSDPPRCKCQPVVTPQGKGIFVDPTGKLQAGTDPRTYMTVDWQQCESARSNLARVDDDRLYRDLFDLANRTNTSFYPIDPRGLAVADTPVDYRDLPQTPTNLQTLQRNADAAHPFAEDTRLREHLETLRNLATATDGTMTETNDLDAGLKKISDDLSDYYLLGYYSTNAKADGRFRKITVRVKQPGVVVRARRGYLAATEAEVAARRAAAAAMDPDLVARDTALSSLGTIRSDRPFHLAAGVGWQSAPGVAARPIIWVTGELDVSAAHDPGWSGGGDVAISVVASGGQIVAADHARMAPTARSFLAQLPAPLAAGDYLVRARAQGIAGTGADAGDQVRIALPGAASGATDTPGQAVLFRRGPFSGPGFQPTADLRFRRVERVRVDVPLAERDAGTSVTAHVLDRRGQDLAIPVTTTLREEGGLRFASAEAALAPLAFGDYLIEVSIRRGATQEKTLAAIRIVP